MSKEHWNKVYEAKDSSEMSWFQTVPELSLRLIGECNLSPSSKIIDIGGGDSLLVDHLLKKGFNDISVLDISTKALQRGKDRQKDHSDRTTWIESDVTSFSTAQKYNLWHDRAAFHFLTENVQIEKYIKVAKNSLLRGGYLIISTFSKSGPNKCSGLEITQYSDEDLKSLFAPYFENIKCVEQRHQTPKDSEQNFTFCLFRKI